MKYVKTFEEFINESLNEKKYSMNDLKKLFKEISDDKNITTREGDNKLTFVDGRGDRMVVNTDGTIEDTMFGSASHIINKNGFKYKK